jgi:phage-related protein (TIGR01555 family)
MKLPTFGFMDSLVNFITGLGTIKDKSTYNQYAFNPLTEPQLNAAYRGDWIARKIVNIPAQDATRAWRTWQADRDVIELLENEEARLGLQTKLKRALIRARLYGGAALILGVDQGTADQELDVEKISQGDLKFVHVVGRFELNTSPDLNYDLTSPYYLQPLWYERRGPSGQAVGTGQKIHPSRVIRLCGEDIPDVNAAITDSMWGDSVLQAVDDAVRACGMTASGIATLINEAKIDVIKIPDFTAKVSTKEYADKLTARFAYANLSKSSVNALVLDAAESWERMTIDFAGMPDIIKQYMVIAAGAADIPATRFLSQSPQGLNATGESDIRNYYDSVHSQQTTTIGPALEPLDQILLRSTLGSFDPAIWYEWESLWQLDEVQKADLAKKKADTSKIYSDMGLIPITAMAKIVENQLIEDGVYPGLEDALAEVEAAGDIIEPPPTPEELLAQQQQQQQQQQLMPPGGGNANGGLGPQKLLPAPARTRPGGVTDFRRMMDMAPRPLYVYRDLLNKEEFFAWARAQGFKDLVPDPHVTIIYSKQSVDWMQMGEDMWSNNPDDKLVIGAGGPRAIELLGNKGAVCLLFHSSRLTWRHEDMVRNGASFDYEEYTPHVTISYDDGTDGDTDISKVEPYRGQLIFGPEIFKEIERDPPPPVTVKVDATVDVDALSKALADSLKDISKPQPVVPNRRVVKQVEHDDKGRAVRIIETTEDV